MDPAHRHQARTERIEVLSAAFHPETGKGQGERRQSLNVAFKPTDSDTAVFEVMSRLPVAPGRYIRLGGPDYQVPMSMATLPDGEYLLTLHVEAGSYHVRRSVRFVVTR